MDDAVLAEATQQSLTGAGAQGRYNREIHDAFWDYAVTFSPRMETGWAKNVVYKVQASISRMIPEAWYQGFAAAGIKRNELTVIELAAMQAFVSEQRMFAEGLDSQMREIRQRYGRIHMTDVRTKEETETGRRLVMNHVPLWRNVWDTARNQAIAMARTDPKLMWRMGPTVEKCLTCLKLANRVYRASTWARYDIHPQHHENLACKGYLCQCYFEATDEPLTPGRPPNVP